MPSDAFIGVLTGLGAAHRERQKNIFDQEVDRRSKYEKLLQDSANNPAYRTEAQDKLTQLYSTLVQTPYEKKLPKDFERQVMDALTSVEISYNLSKGGPTQTLTAGEFVPQRTEVPEPAPFREQVPARFSAEEKFAEAMRLLNAQLASRGRSEIETERAKLAMQPDEAFAFGREAGLATRRGKVIREPAPEKPPNLTNLSRRWVLLGDSKEPVQVLDQLDPADPKTVGRTFLPQAGGQMLDVTGQPMRPAGRDSGTSDALLNQIRSVDLAMKRMELETATKAAPGQLIYAATGRPVPDQRIGDQAALRLGRFETAITQSDVVRNLLDKIGSTGAVKGYVLEHGVYWPIAQDGISADQVAAVTEIQRMVNNYIYAVSGAQINENELVRIAKTAPSLRFTPEANNAVLANFKRFVETEQKNYLKQRGWAHKQTSQSSADPLGIR